MLRNFLNWLSKIAHTPPTLVWELTYQNGGSPNIQTMLLKGDSYEVLNLISVLQDSGLRVLQTRSTEAELLVEEVFGDGGYLAAPSFKSILTGK